MLSNGNFEKGWGGSHRCTVVRTDGTIMYSDIGNIFTPADWLTWFYHAPTANPNSSFDQPEVRDTHLPERIQDGNKATLLFTFYRRHDAGFLQQVDATEGKKYRLTAYAHAWSNHKDGPHPDDPAWSEGAGYDAAFWLEGTQPETGEAQQDAKSNFTFYVGIDPTGNTDPNADTVVWGEGAHIYNEYAQVPEVVVTAQADTITVFLHSRTKWAFKHNDAYWDNVLLTGITNPVDCVPPRVQYDRTYILLPQMLERTAYDWRTGAGLGSAHMLATVGHSADDAGVGPLNRTVIAVNPWVWTGNTQDLIDFYNLHYPGIKFVGIAASTPWELAVKLAPPLEGDYNFGQTWEDWKGSDFGEHPGGGTIGGYGCLLTALSIILSKTYQKKIVPSLLDKVLCASRAAYTDDNILLWNAISSLFSAFDDTIKDNYRRSAKDLETLLDAGWEVVLRRYDGAHFVYLESVEGNVLHIIDTWDGLRKSKYAEDFQGVRALHNKEVAPPPPPPTKKTRGYIGLHLQGNAAGVGEFVRDVKPAIMKCATGFERIVSMKHESPDTICVIRHVNNDYGGILDNPNPLEGARNWIAQFRGSLYDLCDNMANMGLKEPYFYVESVNEVMPSLNEFAVTRAVNLDLAYIDALAELNLPIAPAVFCVAVGNPHETEYELLVPLAKKCAAHGGMMGYHNYWPRNPNAGGPEALGEYLALRWMGMDEVFTTHGAYVDWYGGESGAVGGEWGEGWVHLMPYNGWKSKECMNGNWDLYLEEIMRMDELTFNWNATHAGRYKGLVLFTTSGPGWGSFDIGTNEIYGIGNSLLARYPTIGS